MNEHQQRAVERYRRYAVGAQLIAQSAYAWAQSSRTRSVQAACEDQAYVAACYEKARDMMDGVALIEGYQT